MVLGTDYARCLRTDEYFRDHGEELETMMEITGCSAMEAIKMATSKAAPVVMMEDKIGSLEKGKLADIIMVEGNPLENISLLKDCDTIKFVMQGGKIKKNKLS